MASTKVVQYSTLVLSFLVIIGASHFAYADIVNYTGLSKTNLGNYTSYSFIDKQKIIGVQESQVCQALLKNHIPNNCIGYDKLKQIDNTNPLVYGMWLNDTWYHRGQTHVKNSYLFSRPGTILVDPDSDYTVRAKMIISQNGDFTYINPDENVTNHFRTEYYNVFVAGCSQAIVSPDLKLINDTIHYMLNDCSDPNFYLNHSKKYSTPDTPFRMNTWQMLQNNWIKTIFNGHQIVSDNHTSGGFGPSDCIHFKCKYIDPGKKW